jgi:prepilin-type processing-associated H-X9-DG protein
MKKKDLMYLVLALVVAIVAGVVTMRRVRDAQLGAAKVACRHNLKQDSPPESCAARVEAIPGAVEVSDYVLIVGCDPEESCSKIVGYCKYHLDKYGETNLLYADGHVEWGPLDRSMLATPAARQPTAATVRDGFVLANMSKAALEKARPGGMKKMKELFKRTDESHVPYMKKIASQHAMSHIMPRTYAHYGIVIPEEYSLVADSIRAIPADLRVDPDSFDLRKIRYEKDGKRIDTNHYTYLVHVKYRTRFGYEVEKGGAREKRETEKAHDMESHHYIFPEAALKELFVLLKIEGRDIAVINGDVYVNPLKEEKRE